MAVLGPVLGGARSVIANQVAVDEAVYDAILLAVRKQSQEQVQPGIEPTADNGSGGPFVSASWEDMTATALSQAAVEVGVSYAPPSDDPAGVLVDVLVASWERFSVPGQELPLADAQWRRTVAESTVGFLDQTLAARFPGGGTVARLIGALQAARERRSTDLLEQVAAQVESLDASARVGQTIFRSGREVPDFIRFGQPPIVPTFFSGREELLEALGQRPAAPTVLTAVGGIGGVGKTQLAAAYFRSHLHVGSPYAMAAWLDARSGLEAQLVALAATLGLGEDPDLGVTVKRLLSWLASAKQPWLLVVDDVTSPGKLGDLLKVGGNGRLVLTSRYADWGKFATVLRVDIFGPEAAAALLRAVAERPDDPEAEALADRLGGLALALVLAGTFCREKTLSFGAYSERLHEHGIAYLDQANDQAYARAVSAVWKDSLDVAADRCASAPLMLAVLSWLDWRSVSRSWLTKGLVDRGPFASEAAIEDALAALRSFALVSLDDERIEVLHGLIAEGAEAPLADSDMDETRSRMVAELLYHALPKVPAPDSDTVAAASETLRHVYQLVDRNATLGEEFMPAMRGTVLQLHEQQDHVRCIPIANATLELFVRCLGPDHEDVIEARANLATSYSQAGRNAEAVALRERVVSDRERVLGPDNPDTVKARANLATSFSKVGRNEEAVALRERVVSDYERLLGAYRPDTLTARANLAASYSKIGRNGDAAAIAEKVVADRERILGRDHPDFLTALANLATYYSKMGRNEEADALREKVLADRDRVLGSDHPDTLTARANLATSYSKVGRNDEAVALRERVVSDYERLRGLYHPDTLTARANLATSYSKVGRNGDAVAIAERVLADRERILGPDHPDTVKARSKLAAYRSSAPEH
jgi:tetratricopeptide (TPR) repeat protein